MSPKALRLCLGYLSGRCTVYTPISLDELLELGFDGPVEMGVFRERIEELLYDLLTGVEEVETELEDDDGKEGD